MFTHEQIARICHEANRAYCTSIGDNSQLPWDKAPGWQRQSAMAGVQFWAEHPDAPPSAGHDAWVAEKVRDGWKDGLVKDPERKTHPCMVPFQRLPKEQQTKDFLFRAVALTCLGFPYIDSDL